MYNNVYYIFPQRSENNNSKKRRTCAGKAQPVKVCREFSYFRMSVSEGKKEATAVAATAENQKAPEKKEEEVKVAETPLVFHWTLPFRKEKTEKYAEILFEEVDKLPPDEVYMFGQKRTIENRRVQAYSLKGSKETYGYARVKGKQRHHVDSRTTKAGRVLDKIGAWFDTVLKEQGCEFESVTAILQLFKECPAGKSPSASNNGLGWHDDRDESIDPDSIVCSFVLGEARPVELISNKVFHQKGARNIPEEIHRPGHGDAYAMKHGVQKTHKHRVRPGYKRRVTATFRARKRTK